MEDKKRGRPIGYKLSEETKEKIRQSRMGKSHSSETRNKISRSLTKHFRRQDPLSDSIECEYSDHLDEVGGWICDAEDDLNSLDDVMTTKRLFYLNQVEITYGQDIERFCHNATPEFLLMLKEDLMASGLTHELSELKSLLE